MDKFVATDLTGYTRPCATREWAESIIKGRIAWFLRDFKNGTLQNCGLRADLDAHELADIIISLKIVEV